MHSTMRNAFGTALTVVVALASQVSSATEAPFRETVKVEIVNVEVHVVDRSGKPITDLELDEVKVFEDDRPVEISHFSLVDRASSGASSNLSSGPVPGGPPTEQVPVQTSDPAENTPLWLVVYVDNLNLRPSDRRRSLEAVARFLDEDLGRGAQVMLVSFDRTIRVHQSFTSDAKSIAVALDEIGSIPCRGARYDDERSDLLQRIDDEESPRIAVESIKNLADSIRHEASLSLDAMGKVIESLSGLPGRKAMLHVSSGLPAIPAAELFMAIEYKFAIGYGVIRMQEWDMKDEYRLLARSANRNGVTIHTLDAAGVRPASSASVHEEGYDTSTIAGNIDFDTGLNLQLPLRQLADETGGYAIINRNNPAPALQTVTESLLTHYSIGFSPLHSGDGEFHTLRVEVARKGAQVQHRSGYIDRSPEALRSERLRASLMFSVEDNPLNVDLTIGAIVESEGGGFVVPIELVIPLENLVLLEEGTEHQGDLRILLAVMDEKGRVSEVVERPLKLRIPNDRFATASDERWRYTHQLIMNGGEQVLALGVHDEVSGITSYLRRTASVGS